MTTTRLYWRAANHHLQQAAHDKTGSAGTYCGLTHCEDCNKERKLQGHHEDYAKPFEMIYLCRSCHSYRHSAQRARLEPKGSIHVHQIEMEYARPVVGVRSAVNMGPKKQLAFRVSHELRQRIASTASKLGLTMQDFFQGALVEELALVEEELNNSTSQE